MQFLSRCYCNKRHKLQHTEARSVATCNVTSWYLFLVPLSGTVSWHLFLVPVPGTYSWYMFLVPVPGTTSWHFILVLLPFIASPRATNVFSTKPLCSLARCVLRFVQMPSTRKLRVFSLDAFVSYRSRLETLRRRRQMPSPRKL